MHSPVTIEHEFASSSLMTLMSTYAMVRKLGYVGHEKMMISLTRNDYMPDVCFWCEEKSSGFEKGQARFPAPGFVAGFVSPETERNDRSIKSEDYAAHGVNEYWIIDPETRFADQYLLETEKYRLHIRSDSGVLKSWAVKGFAIPVLALFDEAENLAALREILSEK